MKALFRLSLLLNLGLMALLGFILSRKPEVELSAAIPMVNDQERQPADVRGAQQPAASGAETKPFHWRQVEPTDYRSYIANLRGIGCPEQTIRNIITADLDAAYASRRQALQRKLSGADPSVAGFVARQGIGSALEALRNEEATTLAALLGPESSSAQAVASASAPASAKRRSSETASPSWPLVFQSLDPGAVPLSDRQLQVIDDLQQWFTGQVGGSDQDPNDPAYRERWLKAQPQVDDMMRGMIGVNAFEDYQLAAKAGQQKAQGND
ncbi:exported hypothetical protein [Verrucomicrobia bacterium]|nr:exported hypothetical protein [Verrucomicrobiota bacterium]